MAIDVQTLALAKGYTRKYVEEHGGGGSVSFDNKTITKNSDGQLQTSIGGYVVDGTYSALFENAEPEALNIYAVKYQQSVVMVSGKTYKINISLDGNAVEYVGTCENKDLTFTDGNTINTNCVLIPRELTGFSDYDIYIGSFALDTFEGVGLLFYGTDTHISLGSDDKLTLSEQTATPEVHYLDGRVIPIDENTLNIDTSNKLCANDIKANYLNSATATSEKLTLKDKNGAEIVYQPTVTAPMNYGGKVDSWENLPTEGLTNGLVYIHATEGTQKIYNAATGAWDGPISAIITIDSVMDDSSVNPVSNKVVKAYVDGIADNKTIVRNNEKLSVPIDLVTLKINSAGKIYAVSPVAQVDEYTIITEDGKTKTQIGGHYKAKQSEYIMQWNGTVSYGERTYGTQLKLIPGETVRVEVSHSWSGYWNNSWSGNVTVNADGSLSSIKLSMSKYSDYKPSYFYVAANGYAKIWNGDADNVSFTFKIYVNRAEELETIEPKVVPIDNKTLKLNSENTIQANIDGTSIYYDETEKALKAKQPTFKGMELAYIQDDGSGILKAYKTNGDQFMFDEMITETTNGVMVIAVYGSNVFIPNDVVFGSEIEFVHYDSDEKNNVLITVNSSNEIAVIYDERMQGEITFGQETGLSFFSTTENALTSWGTGQCAFTSLNANTLIATMRVKWGADVTVPAGNFIILGNLKAENEGLIPTQHIWTNAYVHNVNVGSAENINSTGILHLNTADGLIWYANTTSEAQTFKANQSGLSMTMTIPLD